MLFRALSLGKLQRFLFRAEQLSQKLNRCNCEKLRLRKMASADEEEEKRQKLAFAKKLLKKKRRSRGKKT